MIKIEPIAPYNCSEISKGHQFRRMTGCISAKLSQDGFPTTPDHHDTEGPGAARQAPKTTVPNVGMLFAKT